MKRIAKALSIFLALLLCVGLLSPLTSTKAAAAPELNKKSKVLFVGGSKVAASTYKGTYTLKIKNKAKKYSCTWNTSDSSIAKVTKKKAGRAVVTAKSVGKATITCTYKDKVTGKKYTLTSKFTIRNNASKVAIGKSGLPEELDVGKKMQLSALMYDENDKSSKRGGTVTDYMTWVSSDKKVATVTSAGIVEAIGEGEATITCYTYQAAKFKDIKHATAKDSVKIKVAKPIPPGLQEAKQATLNKIDLYFDKDFSKEIKKEDIQISKKVTSTYTSTVLVKSLVFDPSGLKATVTLNDDLEHEKEYTVKVKDVEKTFTALKGEIVSFEMYTTGGNVAVAGANQNIYFAFFNANGIDITPTKTTDYNDLAGKINISSQVSNYQDLIVFYTTRQVMFLNPGKTAVIDAEFHTQKFDIYGKETVLKSSVVLTSVSEASTIKFVDFLITNDFSMDGEDFDWEEKSTSLAEGDYGYRLIVNALDGNGKDIYSDQVSKFKFESGNPQVLIVDSTNAGYITPIRTGEVDVAVYYDTEFIDSIHIKIGAKRFPAQLLLDKQTAEVSNFPGYADCTFNVTALDQYGTQVPLTYLSNVTITPSISNAPSTIPTYNSDGTMDVQFSGVGRGYGASNQEQFAYTIKLGEAVTTFVATVKNPTGPSSYNLELATVDLKKLQTSTEHIYVDLNVYEYRNGVKCGKLAGSIYPESNSVAVGSYYYKITSPSSTKTTEFTQQDGKFMPYTIATGNEIKKPKLLGTYSIIVFQKGISNDTYVASGQFRLQDTTPKAVITKKAEKATTPINSNNKALIISALFECYSVKVGNTLLTASNVADVNSAGVNGQVHIYSIDVKTNVTLGGTIYTIPTTIEIGKLITN